VGDTDAPVVAENGAERVPPAGAVGDAEGEAQCEAEGVVDAHPEEDGEKEAVPVLDAKRDSEALPEANVDPLPKALPLPSVLTEAVAQGVTDTEADTEGGGDTVPQPVAVSDAVPHAVALPQLVADSEDVHALLPQLLPLPLADTQLEALAVEIPLRVFTAVCDTRAGVADAGPLALPREEAEGEVESLRLPVWHPDGGAVALPQRGEADAKGDAVAPLLPEGEPLGDLLGAPLREGKELCEGEEEEEA
jgi:hypothetical protein